MIPARIREMIFPALTPMQANLPEIMPVLESKQNTMQPMVARQMRKPQQDIWKPNLNEPSTGFFPYDYF